MTWWWWPRRRGPTTGAQPAARRDVLVACVAIGALSLMAISADRAYRWGYPPTVHGLPAAKRPVVMAGIDYRTWAARVRPALAGARCTAVFLEGFDLASFVSWREKMAPLQVYALYLPGTDTVAIPLGPSRVPRHVLAHELAHGILDQYVPTSWAAARTSTLDATLAWRALQEGIAEAASGPVTTREARYGADYLSNVDALLYQQAPLWAATQSGPLLHAVTIGPRTTFEFLFPGVPLTDYAVVPDSAGAQETTTCSDELGALAVYSAVRRRSGSTAWAVRAARAWRGDRAERVNTLHGPYLRWRVRWGPEAGPLRAQWATWFGHLPTA